MLNTISNFLPSFVWTLGSGLVLTLGDLMLRSWFQTKWTLGFELTFVIYAIGIFFMMLSFFQQNIAIATVAAVVVNALAYLLITYLLYGDTISLWQMVGIILGLAALAMVEVA